LGRALRRFASTRAARTFPLGRVSVDVAHAKVHAADCVDCAAHASPEAKIDRFTRTIAVDSEVTEELRSKIIEIAKSFGHIALSEITRQNLPGRNVSGHRLGFVDRRRPRRAVSTRPTTA
jgi:hypothetical protein